VAASPGIELKTAPEGYVKIHANHHLWSRTRIGEAQADGQFKVVAESPDLIEPNPFRRATSNSRRRTFRGETHVGFGHS